MEADGVGDGVLGEDRVDAGDLTPAGGGVLGQGPEGLTVGQREGEVASGGVTDEGEALGVAPVLAGVRNLTDRKSVV